jgi:acyl carrier protein
MDTLKRVISTVLNIEYEKIDDNLSRDTTDEWDSFNHLMLMSEVEKAFNLSFSLQEIEKARSFIDIQALISCKKM